MSYGGVGGPSPELVNRMTGGGQGGVLAHLTPTKMEKAAKGQCIFHGFTAGQRMKIRHLFNVQ